MNKNIKNFAGFLSFSLLSIAFSFIVSNSAQAAAVSAPTFSLNGGAMAATVLTKDKITLTSATAGATIYYTIDGSTPTTGSMLYNASIGVDLQPIGTNEFFTGSKTVKAIATKVGSTNSAVTTSVFTVKNKDQAARDTLKSSYGISVNADDCWAFTGKKRCTSLVGIRQTTLDELGAFTRACDAVQPPFNMSHTPWGNLCGVVLTGGTEDGHTTGTYSHANGYKVDVSPVSAVGTYIASTTYFKVLPNVIVDGVSVKQYSRKTTGKIYTHEAVPDHWDILVQ